MKITAFSAKGVQGSLRFDLEFRDDYTFLIGLNGSGKTSALRLMMALLAPDLPELARLKFESASLFVVDAGRERQIFARKSVEGMALGISGIESALLLTAAELQLLEQPAPAGESTTPVLSAALLDPVCRNITDLATPMFLGVDRRFSGGASLRDFGDLRRREFLTKRAISQVTEIERGNVSAGLADVHVLVHDTLNEIRSAQEQLDEDFRSKLLTSAFDYKPVAVGELQAPSTASITEYQEKRDEIESALNTLKVPVGVVSDLLEHFFARMNKVAEELKEAKDSGGSQHVKVHRKSERYGAHSPPVHKSPTEIPSPTIIEWMINKPQVERITTHLALLTSYNSERAALRAPIDRFLSLLNSFLADTGKYAFVTERGELMVKMPSGVRQSVGALSSGERQLVVMLGHLSLNKLLSVSGIFIVDEPELSLHISWQERFLDAIREANPSVQIVMATHSPAIILQRDDHCESLDQVGERT